MFEQVPIEMQREGKETELKWSKFSLGYPGRSFFEATRKEADFPEDLKRRRSLMFEYKFQFMEHFL